MLYSPQCTLNSFTRWVGCHKNSGTLARFFVCSETNEETKIKKTSEGAFKINVLQLYRAANAPWRRQCHYDMNLETQTSRDKITSQVANTKKHNRKTTKQSMVLLISCVISVGRVVDGKTALYPLLAVRFRHKAFTLKILSQVFRIPLGHIAIDGVASRHN